MTGPHFSAELLPFLCYSLSSPSILLVLGKDKGTGKEVQVNTKYACATRGCVADDSFFSGFSPAEWNPSVYRKEVLPSDGCVPDTVRNEQSRGIYMYAYRRVTTPGTGDAL